MDLQSIQVARRFGRHSVLQGGAPSVAAGNQGSVSPDILRIYRPQRTWAAGATRALSGSNLAAQHQYISTGPGNGHCSGCSNMRTTRSEEVAVALCGTKSIVLQDGRCSRFISRATVRRNSLTSTTAEFSFSTPRLEFIRANSLFPPAVPPVGSAGRPTIRMKSKGSGRCRAPVQAGTSGSPLRHQPDCRS